MVRFISVVAVFAATLSAPAIADVAQKTMSLSKAYRTCLSLNAGEQERLKCHEELAPKLLDLTKEVTASIGPKCEVEDWTYSRRGNNAHIVGSSTCAKGKLNYRLYDGDKFLTAGFTFIDGFAFQAFEAIPELPNMEMKYSISE